MANIHTKSATWLAAIILALSVVALAIECNGVRCATSVCSTPVGCDSCKDCQYRTNRGRLNWTCPYTRSSGQIVTGLCRFKSGSPGSVPDACGNVKAAECVDLCARTSCPSTTVCETTSCDFKTGGCTYTILTNKTCISEANTTTAVCATYRDSSGALRGKCSEWCVGVNCASVIDYCTIAARCDANTGACVRTPRNVGLKCSNQTTSSGTTTVIKAIPCTSSTCPGACGINGYCRNTTNTTTT